MHLQKLIAFFLVGMATLALETAFTRVFSIMYFYHYGFFIISTAMAGLGLGAVLAAMKIPRFLFNDDYDHAGLIWLGTAIITPLSFLAVVIYQFQPYLLGISAADTGRFLLDAVFLTAPFIAIGMGCALVFARYAATSGKVYGVNMAGGALGALVAWIFFETMRPGWVILIVSGIFALVALLWTNTESNKAAKRERRIKEIVAFIMLSALAMYAVFTEGESMRLPVCTGKMLSFIPEDSVIHTQYDAMSRVDFFDQPVYDAAYLGLWGISPTYKGAPPTRLGITIDGWAYTSSFRPTDPQNMPMFFQYLPSTLVYQTGFSPRNALIIGSGGGLDVWGAYFNKVERIDAVEINANITSALTGKLRKEAGDVFTKPGVTLHTAEGRGFAEHTKNTYDLVQLSGVDTYSSTAAGAYSLTENYLYTVEAFETYLKRLNKGGMLTLTRWYLPDEQGYERYSFRLLTLAREAIERMGSKIPETHILFARAGAYTLMIVGKDPIPETLRARFYERCAHYQYEVLFPRPFGMADNRLSSFMKLEDTSQFFADYPYDVTPPTDGHPFFFEVRRPFDLLPKSAAVVPLGQLDGQSMAALLLFETICILAIVLVWALLLIRRRGRKLPGSTASSARGIVLYMLGIGLGFMLVEIVLTQALVLLLGHPIYALLIVLSGILVFSGIGSMISARLQPNSNMWVALVVAAIAAMLALILMPLIHAAMPATTALRFVAGIAITALVGIPMGMPFPLALRQIDTSGHATKTAAIAINSAASVCGSVLAVFLSLSLGFAATLLAAALAYGIAGFGAYRLRGSR